MQIRFSRQSKRQQSPNSSPSQCRLFNYNLLTEPVVERRKTFSRRKHKPNPTTNTRSGIKLLKNIIIRKSSTEIQLPPAIIKDKPMISQCYNKKLVIHEQNIIPQQTQQNTQNQKYCPAPPNKFQFFQGSWGILKFSKPPQPLKQIPAIPKSQFNSTQPESRKNQSNIKIIVQKTPSHKTQKSEDMESWKFSKYMNSTRGSRNQQPTWRSSVKLVESRVMNPEVKSQQFYLNLPQKTTNHDKDNFNPISNLNDANTVFSQYSQHSRELSQQKLNKSSKALKQSLVLGNDINESGFWN